MTEAIKNWISGIAVTAIIVSVVQGFMPKGSVKRIFAVICSCALIIALAAPITGWTIPDLSEYKRNNDELTQRYMDKLADTNNELTQIIIQEQYESYILDKANKLGTKVDAKVITAFNDDAECLPVGVEIFASCSPVIKTALSEYISDELGIPQDMQIWRDANE